MFGVGYFFRRLMLKGVQKFARITIVKEVKYSAKLAAKRTRKRFIKAGVRSKMILNFPGVAVDVLWKYFVLYETIAFMKATYSMTYSLVNPESPNLSAEEKEEANSIFKILADMDDDTFALVLAAPSLLLARQIKGLNITNSASSDGTTASSKWSFINRFGATKSGETQVDGRSTKSKSRGGGRRTAAGFSWTQMRSKFNGMNMSSILQKAKFSPSGVKYAAALVGVVGFIQLISAITSTEESKATIPNSEDDESSPEWLDDEGQKANSATMFVAECMHSHGISPNQSVGFDGKKFNVYRVVQDLMKSYDQIVREPSRGWARFTSQLSNSRGYSYMDRLSISSLLEEMFNTLVGRQLNMHGGSADSVDVQQSFASKRSLLNVLSDLDAIITFDPSYTSYGPFIMSDAQSRERNDNTSSTNEILKSEWTKYSEAESTEFDGQVQSDDYLDRYDIGNRHG